MRLLTHHHLDTQRVKTQFGACRHAPFGLVMNNYATHKHRVVPEWLATHPRFNMHFTPTPASWLSMVERFFRDISENRLRRGVFRRRAEAASRLAGSAGAGARP